MLVTNRLETGGAERMLISLAKSLDPDRVVPVVGCLKDAGPLASQLRKAGVHVHDGLLRHRADVFVIERLRRLFATEQIDVVCPVGSGGDRMFWSTLAARTAGIPCVVWSHVHPVPEHTAFELSNRALYRGVARFVALGHEHREALIRLEKVPADRVEIIRNGIDVDAFDRPDLRGKARRRLGIENNETVAVAIVANLRPDKRHDVFIEAASRLADSHRQAVFYVIGDGSQRDRVASLAAETGLSADRLRILGDRGDVSVLLQGLDIVCLCSEWQECQSIVMLEAMAAGRAFVGPAIGSLDEALVDGETGRFVRPGDAESLTEVLDELIADPQQREALGRRARRKVISEFRVRHMAEGFETLIRSLVPVREMSASRPMGSR